MRMSTGFALACLLGTGLLIGSVGAAQEGKNEKAVSLKSLPAAVQRTAREQCKGTTIRGFSKEVGEAGKMVYEVTTTVGGRGRDMIIAADGTLLIVEQEVTLASLPAAVRATIEKNAGKRKIMLVETVTQSDTLAYYEAQVRGRTMAEIKVARDGQLIR